MAFVNGENAMAKILVIDNKISIYKAIKILFGVSLSKPFSIETLNNLVLGA